MPRKKRKDNGRRRGKGEGSITERPDGYWQASVLVGYDPQTGKPKRKYFFGKTEKEVQKKLNEANYHLDRGTFTDPGKITLGSWLKRWVEIYKRGTVSTKTFELYFGLIEHHINPEIGNIKLDKLKTSDIQQFLNSKALSGRVDGQPGGLSKSTLKHTYNVIRQALGQATKPGERLLNYNPASEVVIPETKPKKPRRVYTARALGDFFELAKERTRIYPALVLAGTMGLRRSEVLGLRLTDIDLETATLTVNQTVIRTNSGVEVMERTKSTHSKRVLAIPQVAIPILKSHLEVLQQEQRRAEEKNLPYKSNNLLFPTSRGTVMDPRNFSRTFQTLAREMEKRGHPRITLHDLRHSCATLMLESGVSIKVISAILGHHSSSFTMDTYIQKSETMEQDALEKINKNMGEIFENNS